MTPNHLKGITVKTILNLATLATVPGGINAYTDKGAAAKVTLHTCGKTFLKALADDLGLHPDEYDLRSNKGGTAVSGEVTLHTEKLYVQLSEWLGSPGVSILYRACNGRGDYTGKQNHSTTILKLTTPETYRKFLQECKGLMN